VRRPFQAFLRFAVENDYSICLNGDAFDIMQLSLHTLTADLTPSLSLFEELGRRKRLVYYTVGNHDIQLEHFLHDVGNVRVAPFINLCSGDKRIRIEHGHTYDEMFLKYPRFYWLFTMLGRFAIAISPAFYHWLHELNHKIVSVAEYVGSGFKARSARREAVSGEVIEGERECFRRGAENVGIRGFDAVIFGHTHLEGALTLSSGVRYFNTGSWFANPHCVAIDRGRLWFGPISELIERGDPFAFVRA
jgi:UDP-2,3-diacylglucosamine pyrophosphatase LpxH